MYNRLQRLSTSQTPDGHGKLKDPEMSGRHFCNASILGIFVVLSVCCVTVDCQALVNQYLIAMYGANEVASGDPRGVGTVNLTLDFSSQNFVFSCRVITASAPSGASLYFGSLDSAGVLVSLTICLPAESQYQVCSNNEDSTYIRLGCKTMTSGNLFSVCAGG